MDLLNRLRRIDSARLGLHVFVLAALFALALSHGAIAQDELAALQIKAAFLHKFPDYVEAPGTAFEESDIPLVFGVAGSERVLAFLSELVAAQNAEMRRAQVRPVASAADLAGVHVLYVGGGLSAEVIDALLAEALANSILTVTDVPAPQPAASMIHFFIEDDRVRFDIALAPAETARLRLSSRLLQVARRVIESGAAPGN